MLNNIGEREARLTAAAFDDPQPGDCFHEMWTWWMFVVWRSGDDVAWMSMAAPGSFPDDATLHAGTVADLKAAYAYGSIPGYTVTLDDRGRPVAGWLESRLTEFGTDLKAAA